MDLITQRMIFILIIIVTATAAANTCEQVDELIKNSCFDDSAQQVVPPDQTQEAIRRSQAMGRQPERAPKIFSDLHKNIHTLNTSVSTFIEDYNNWSTSRELNLMAAAGSLLRVHQANDKQLSNETNTRLYLIRLSLYANVLKTQVSRQNFQSACVSERLQNLTLSLKGTVCALKRLISSDDGVIETYRYHDCQTCNVSSELSRAYTMVVVKMIGQTLSGIELNVTSKSVHLTEPVHESNESPILKVGKVLSRKRICRKNKRKPLTS